MHACTFKAESHCIFQSWPQTHKPLASMSHVLGLYMCIVCNSHMYYFLKRKLYRYTV